MGEAAIIGTTSFGMLCIHPDSTAAYRAVADTVVRIAGQAVSERERFDLALAGGSTPRGLYRLLATAPYRLRIDWGRTHVFFGDERYVPRDHPDSNHRMAEQALLRHIPLPPGHVHPVPTEAASAPEAARRYRDLLSRELPVAFDDIPRFDLILLGLGSDGHTASLFPGSPILEERRRSAAAVYVRALASWRISLTYPVLDHARALLFLVTGRTKAAVLRRIFEEGAPATLPVQAIRPRGDVEWHVDRAAGAGLAGIRHNRGRCGPGGGRIQ